MRILILAEAINVDATSAGLGTSKLIEALHAEPGIKLTCLHADFDRKEYPWINARLIRVVNKPWTWHNVLYKIKRIIDDRLGTRLNERYQKATGYTHKFWHDVRMYAKQIQDLVDKEDFDLIFTRAKGSSFRMHAAMLQVKTDITWIAYYHDPYPFSQYPKPYAYEIKDVSEKQEELNAEIIEKADVVAAPTDKLLEWIGHFNEEALDKGEVIPHPGYELEELPSKKNILVDESKFICLHAGTMLGARNPKGLLEAWRQLCDSDHEFESKSQLVIIGKVDAGISFDLGDSKNIRIITERIPYADSLSLLQKVSVSIILEANAKDHPFFPGKLADALYFQKPVLALSSEESGTLEVLRSKYPFHAEPLDVEGIKQQLKSLFELWKKDQLKKVSEEMVDQAVSVDAETIAGLFKKIINENE